MTNELATTRLTTSRGHFLIVAATAIAVGVTTPVLAFSPSDCPSYYQCEVAALAVSGGSVAIHAWVAWPTGLAPNDLPRHAWIVVDRVDYEAVAITWTIVDYVSGCASEVRGVITTIATPGTLSPGSIVEVDFGKTSCKNVVPRRPDIRTERPRVRSGPADGDPPGCNETGDCEGTLETDGPVVSGISLIDP